MIMKVILYRQQIRKQLDDKFHYKTEYALNLVLSKPMVYSTVICVHVFFPMNKINDNLVFHTVRILTLAEHMIYTESSSIIRLAATNTGFHGVNVKGRALTF